MEKLIEKLTGKLTAKLMPGHVKADVSALVIR